MTGSARRVVVRLPRARREQDILDAAHAVFEERGYEATAVSEIAERAGVVEGTVYKYFESKRALLYRVMARWYEAMLADYEEHLAEHRGTRNRLRFVVRRHLKSIEENPALCRVFFREIRGAEDYRGSAIYHLNRRYTHVLMEILRGGIAEGDVRRDVKMTLVRDMIYGGVEHHTWNYVSRSGGLDVDAVADSIVDIVMGGIAPPQAEPTLDRLGALVDRLERRLDATEEAG
jgi:AcrR family transcriptional regulator